MKRMTGNKSKRYYIYGHSAGGDFVHRLLLFKPNARVQTAIAANAVSYTMPTFGARFPYGLRRSGITPEQQKEVFGKRLIILLGDEDPNFEKGIAFYKASEAKAAELGAQFRWELEKVPGVGHSNRNLAPWAADVLFGSESR